MSLITTIKQDDHEKHLNFQQRWTIYLVKKKNNLNPEVWLSEDIVKIPRYIIATNAPSTIGSRVDMALLEEF